MYGKKDVQKALTDYEERFNKGFPTFYFLSNGDVDGMMDEIKKSLDTGKPYKPKMKRGTGKKILY